MVSFPWFLAALDYTTTWYNTGRHGRLAPARWVERIPALRHSRVSQRRDSRVHRRVAAASALSRRRHALHGFFRTVGFAMGERHADALHSMADGETYSAHRVGASVPSRRVCTRAT